MDYFAPGWLWLYFGALLMFAELLTPGFVIFFFGLSAATVGVLALFLGESFDLTWQLASFSVLAIAYLVLLRRWVTGIFTGLSDTSKGDFDHESIGRLGTVTEAITPARPGRVLIGDAQWTATADEPLDVGIDVKVTENHNLTMKVEKIS